jgi:hypothetical protein
VNLPDQLESVEFRRFKRSFGGLLERHVPHDLIRHWVIRIEEEDAGELSKEERVWKYWLLPLRNGIRVIWQDSDMRLRRIGVFRLLEIFLQVGDRKLSFGPVTDDTDWFLSLLQPPTFIEDALMQLLECPNATKVCGNAKCQTKYFFAFRRSQKYCSEPCARPAQRWAKNKWWAAHGPEWRKARKPAKAESATKRHCRREK